MRGAEAQSQLVDEIERRLGEPAPVSTAAGAAQRSRMRTAAWFDGRQVCTAWPFAIDGPVEAQHQPRRYGAVVFAGGELLTHDGPVEGRQYVPSAVGDGP